MRTILALFFACTLSACHDDVTNPPIAPAGTVSVQLFPDDAIILPDTTFKLSLYLDQASQRVYGGAQYEAVGDAVRITSEGDVTGVKGGIALIRARGRLNGATVVESTYVAVIPTYTLAATFRSRIDSPGAFGIASIRDQLFWRFFTTGFGVSAWEPRGGRVVFGPGNIAVFDSTGLSASFAIPGFASVSDPSWGTDGWIYFHGTQTNSSTSAVGRVRPDGSTPEVLLNEGRPLFPSLAPDGSKLLLHHNGALATINMQSKSLTKVTGTDGVEFARWSPDGRWIAYRQNTAIIVRPADTGPEKKFDNLQLAGRIVSWSADSNLLIAQVAGANTTAALIDVNSGRTMTVFHLSGIVGFDWKK